MKFINNFLEEEEGGSYLIPNPNSNFDEDSGMRLKPAEM